MNRVLRHGLGVGIVVGIALAAGCAPAGRISLIQPQITGFQRELPLSSDQVHWADSQGVERLVADFPLPGARTGRPTYLLYLRWPTGMRTAGFSHESDAARLAGFMIQIRGQYAGLARVNGGQITIRGTSQAPGSERHITLDLTCEDGSQIVGVLTAKRDDYAVAHFENHRRPADVQALVKSSPVAPASRPKP